MAENTKIEWAHHTFNPWEGCQKIGPGCDNCYAETRNARFAGGRAVNWGPGAPRRRTGAANWNKPLRWNAEAEKLGIRYRVFCASLADVFDNAVSDGWRMDLFKLIADTPHLDWLLLTKRIGNVMPMCSRDGLMFDMIGDRVWLGATITNQQEADRDIPKLLAVPARIRFLSMEPLLGPVDLTRIDINGHSEVCPLIGTTDCENDDGDPMPDIPALDWVIVGGESGSNARPMHPDWARSLRDQCQAAGVPFLFKQWGEYAPGDACQATSGDAMYDLLEAGRYCVVGYQGDTHPRDAMLVSQPSEAGYRAGKKAAGRLLDGRTWNEFPEPEGRYHG